MQRYFMHLAYRGEPFHGWQTQPGAVTVQQTVEAALAVVLRMPVKITGAGRTDTGVNARMMMAHFDLPEPLAMPAEKVVGAVNALTGHDIAIYSIYPVAPDLHARFSAISRTYHYYAIEGSSPFFHALSWKAPKGLDFELMNQAASYLLTTSDFTSFAKLHSDSKTNICHVSHAAWHPVTFPGDPTRAWVFIITADRFLRNMVRAVVGTLVEVGRHKITPEQFAAIIECRDRCAAGTSMPPQALYLWDIKYPDAPHPDIV